MYEYSHLYCIVILVTVIHLNATSDFFSFLSFWKKYLYHHTMYYVYGYKEILKYWLAVFIASTLSLSRCHCNLSDVVFMCHYVETYLYKIEYCNSVSFVEWIYFAWWTFVFSGLDKDLFNGVCSVTTLSNTNTLLGNQNFSASKIAYNIHTDACAPIQ